MSDLTPSQFDVDKWQAENDRAERKLQLDARAQDVREEEVKFKREELGRSRWTNPLTVAVAATALAALSNTGAILLNGSLQRNVEQEKATQSKDLEQSKAEAQRILEVIKVGDPKKVADNLSFLLHSGLISSGELNRKLENYLRTTRPEDLPALPVTGTRFQFEQNGSMTRAAEAGLEADLRQFETFVQAAGLRVEPRNLRIRIAELPQVNAYYELDSQTMHIDARIAGNPYPARREFMHHVLYSLRPEVKDVRPYYNRNDLADIESGLADYFSASFSNSPVLGEGLAAAFGIRERTFVRVIENDLKYTPRSPDAAPTTRGEIWAGAFWDLRRRMPAGVADRVLATSWQAMSPTGSTPLSFDQSLAKAAKDGGQDWSAIVTQVLRERDLPL